MGDVGHGDRTRGGRTGSDGAIPAGGSQTCAVPRGWEVLRRGKGASSLKGRSVPSAGPSEPVKSVCRVEKTCVRVRFVSRSAEQVGAMCCNYCKSAV